MPIGGSKMGSRCTRFRVRRPDAAMGVRLFGGWLRAAGYASGVFLCLVTHFGDWRLELGSRCTRFQIRRPDAAKGWGLPVGDGKEWGDIPRRCVTARFGTVGGNVSAHPRPYRVCVRYGGDATKSRVRTWPAARSKTSGISALSRAFFTSPQTNGSKRVNVKFRSLVPWEPRNSQNG